MFEPKIPAICASIGFVLSLLIGIFSGASFFVVLFRAFGFGLLFAVLAFFSRIIILRFIPELFNASDSADIPETGNIVDITLGEFDKDENLFEGQENAGSGGMVPDFMEPETQTYSQPSDSDSEPVSVKAQGEFIRTDYRSEAQSAGSKNPEMKTENPRTAGGLDVLPDLQDFIPPVTVGPEDIDDNDSSSSSGGMQNSLFSAPDSPAMNAESETMVKAIRTILAKDK